MIRTLTKYLFTKVHINSVSNQHWLSSIKKQIKNNPNYVKENGVFITHHLADLFQKYQYENILKILKQVDTKHIDKWQLWVQLSKTINNSINNPSSITQPKLQQLMQILFKLKYQPHPKQDKLYYQLISNTLKQNSHDFNQLSKTSAYTLMYLPTIFIKYRHTIQHHLLEHFQKANQIDWQMTYLYAQGVISNFWTKQFHNQIINLIQSPRLQKHKQKFQKYVTLPDINYSTKIQKKILKNLRSSTEKKIGEMLLDLGYILQQNIFINNTEVDFLLGKDIIVSYNGMHHYRINSKKGKIEFTQYDLWKNQMLENRKFKIVHIPFYQWQKLQNQKVQKLYLISKIENFILSTTKQNLK